jgi:hypothetical protein
LCTTSVLYRRKPWHHEFSFLVVQIAVWKDWLDLQGGIQKDYHYLFLSPIYRWGAQNTSLSWDSSLSSWFSIVSK